MTESYEPLTEIPTIVKTDGPPEPPIKPLTGSPFEQKGDEIFCRVPGCSRPKDKPFIGRQGIAIHLGRIHGLGMDGKLYEGPRRHAAVAPAVPVPDVPVRGLLTQDQKSVVYQAMTIVENLAKNLTGKLSEMDALKLKEAKLVRIADCIRELL